MSKRGTTAVAARLATLTRAAIPKLAASDDAAACSACAAFRTILGGRQAIYLDAIDAMDATEHHGSPAAMAAHELAIAWFDFAAQPRDRHLTPASVADLEQCVRQWLDIPALPDTRP